MTAFLWTITILGIGELLATVYYALNGELPPRSPGQMVFNAFVRFGLLCAR